MNAKVIDDFVLPTQLRTPGRRPHGEGKPWGKNFFKEKNFFLLALKGSYGTGERGFFTKIPGGGDFGWALLNYAFVFFGFSWAPFLAFIINPWLLI
jgi:hypothetical protein